MLKPITLAALLAVTTAAFAEQPALPDPAQGFLCCNVRTDGKWISDINYQENGQRLVPLGTPVKATGYGRYRVYVDLAGGKQAIGNDYSRSLDMTSFAKRYVVADDPAKKLAAFDPKVRKAIEHAQVMPGMTREQVLMSLGYPITSENPSLEANIWRYWIDSDSEYQVVFEGDRVKDVSANPRTRGIVVAQ
jgi:hypothetical protein